jgi:hypothetical protein
MVKPFYPPEGHCLNWLRAFALPTDTVLDVGSGDRRYHDIGVAKITTVDIWPAAKPDYLLDLEKDDLPPGNYSLILLLDVLEHLSPERGKDILAQAQSLARRAVVAWTPLEWDENRSAFEEPGGFYEGNERIFHKSLWKESDFAIGWTRIHLPSTKGCYLGYWRKTPSAGRFLLISEMRAGTQLIFTALSNHPNLAMKQVDGMKGGLAELVGFKGDPAEKRRLGTCTHLWCEQHIWENFGLDPFTFWREMADQVSYRAIIITRKNQLRRYLSSCIAFAAAGKGFDVSLPREGSPRVHFDMNDFEAALEDRRGAAAVLKRVFPYALTLFYEDLILEWTKTIDKVEVYLEVKRLPLEIETFLQESRPVSAIISNWSPALEDELRARGYGEWID